MRRNSMIGSRHGLSKRRSKVTMAVALVGVSLFSLMGTQITGHKVAGAVTQASTASGFTIPFSGTPQYEHLAPTEITNPGQLHQPIGQQVADEIAAELG